MTDAGQRGALARELSNQIALVLRNYTGRGPTRTHVFIESDVVTCVLRGCLTKGEQRLVEADQRDAVLRMRRTYQEAMSAELTATVEKLTGRRVTAHLNDYAVGPDVAIEAFVLEVAWKPGSDLSDPVDRNTARDG